MTVTFARDESQSDDWHWIPDGADGPACFATGTWWTVVMDDFNLAGIQCHRCQAALSAWLLTHPDISPQD